MPLLIVHSTSLPPSTSSPPTTSIPAAPSKTLLAVSIIAGFLGLALLVVVAGLLLRRKKRGSIPKEAVLAPTKYQDGPVAYSFGKAELAGTSKKKMKVFELHGWSRLSRLSRLFELPASKDVAELPAEPFHPNSRRQTRSSS